MEGFEEETNCSPNHDVPSTQLRSRNSAPSSGVRKVKVVVGKKRVRPQTQNLCSQQPQSHQIHVSEMDGPMTTMATDVRLEGQDEVITAPVGLVSVANTLGEADNAYSHSSLSSHLLFSKDTYLPVVDHASRHVISGFTPDILQCILQRACEGLSRSLSFSVSAAVGSGGGTSVPRELLVNSSQTFQSQGGSVSHSKSTAVTTTTTAAAATAAELVAHLSFGSTPAGPVPFSRAVPCGPLPSADPLHLAASSNACALSASSGGEAFCSSICNVSTNKTNSNSSSIPFFSSFQKNYYTSSHLPVPDFSTFVSHPAHLLFSLNDKHATIFRRLRAHISAAAQLGNRSSHALWGSEQSGKRRIISTLGSIFRGTASNGSGGNNKSSHNNYNGAARARGEGGGASTKEAMLVLELDGNVIRGDDEAIRRIVEETRQFLQTSPAAARLRRRHAGLQRLGLYPSLHDLLALGEDFEMGTLLDDDGDYETYSLGVRCSEDNKDSVGGGGGFAGSSRLRQGGRGGAVRMAIDEDVLEGVWGDDGDGQSDSGGGGRGGRTQVGLSLFDFEGQEDEDDDPFDHGSPQPQKDTSPSSSSLSPTTTDVGRSLFPDVNNNSNVLRDVSSGGCCGPLESPTEDRKKKSSAPTDMSPTTGKRNITFDESSISNRNRWRPNANNNNNNNASGSSSSSPAHNTSPSSGGDHTNNTNNNSTTNNTNGSNRFVAGPASSTISGALTNLQACFVYFNHIGISLVVLIHNIKAFGYNCDRVMYILSGLMHETTGSSEAYGGGGGRGGRGRETEDETFDSVGTKSAKRSTKTARAIAGGRDGGGDYDYDGWAEPQYRRQGGVSFVVSSLAPDVTLEKRLSSRLTCEMWYCPPLVQPPLTILPTLFQPINSTVTGVDNSVMAHNHYVARGDNTRTSGNTNTSSTKGDPLILSENETVLLSGRSTMKPYAPTSGVVQWAQTSVIIALHAELQTLEIETVKLFEKVLEKKLREDAMAQRKHQIMLLQHNHRIQLDVLAQEQAAYALALSERRRALGIRKMAAAAEGFRVHEVTNKKPQGNKKGKSSQTQTSSNATADEYIVEDINFITNKRLTPAEQTAIVGHVRGDDLPPLPPQPPKTISSPQPPPLPKISIDHKSFEELYSEGTFEGLSVDDTTILLPLVIKMNRLRRELAAAELIGYALNYTQYRDVKDPALRRLIFQPSRRTQLIIRVSGIDEIVSLPPEVCTRDAVAVVAASSNSRARSMVATGGSGAAAASAAASLSSSPQARGAATRGGEESGRVSGSQTDHDRKEGKTPASPRVAIAAPSIKNGPVGGSGGATESQHTMGVLRTSLMAALIFAAQSLGTPLPNFSAMTVPPSLPSRIALAESQYVAYHQEVMQREQQLLAMQQQHEEAVQHRRALGDMAEYPFTVPPAFGYLLEPIPLPPPPPIPFAFSPAAAAATQALPIMWGLPQLETARALVRPFIGQLVSHGQVTQFVGGSVVTSSRWALTEVLTRAMRETLAPLLDFTSPDMLLSPRLLEVLTSSNSSMSSVGASTQEKESGHPLLLLLKVLVDRSQRRLYLNTISYMDGISGGGHMGAYERLGGGGGAGIGSATSAGGMRGPTSDMLIKAQTGLTTMTPAVTVDANDSLHSNNSKLRRILASDTINSIRSRGDTFGVSWVVPSAIGAHVAPFALPPSGTAALTDLLDDGNLVRFGYACTEHIVLLSFIYARIDSGLKRNLRDLQEDIANTLRDTSAAGINVGNCDIVNGSAGGKKGPSAASKRAAGAAHSAGLALAQRAARDAAYATAFSDLKSWGLIGEDRHGDVYIVGPSVRLHDFLRWFLSDSTLASQLGMDAMSRQTLANLVR